jgi:hypothetical protein
VVVSFKLDKLNFPIDKILSTDDEEQKSRKLGRNFNSLWNVAVKLKEAVDSLESGNYLKVLKETNEYIIAKGKQGNIRLKKE